MEKQIEDWAEAQPTSKLVEIVALDAVRAGIHKVPADQLKARAAAKELDHRIPRRRP